MHRAAALSVLALTATSTAQAKLPAGFSAEVVLDAGRDPASFKFAPDGRLFVGRRITGELVVATRSGSGWRLGSRPYHVFDTPKSKGAPSRHRSSGLRGFAFDPDFAKNGHVYAFYMKDNPRQNRVVRITQERNESQSRALAGSEKLLIAAAVQQAATASGSHNGGADRIRCATASSTSRPGTGGTAATRCSR